MKIDLVPSEYYLNKWSTVKLPKKSVLCDHASIRITSLAIKNYLCILLPNSSVLCSNFNLFTTYDLLQIIRMYF